MTDDGLIWFRTNSIWELIESAEFARQQIWRLADDHSAFRWTTIASALALQGALVYQIDGNDTSRTATLSENSRSKTLAYLNDRKSNNYPSQRLAAPKELLNRVKNSDDLVADFSKAWDESDQKNCERLLDLRNEFAHFLPQGWSHCLNGYSEVLRSVWTIIRNLVESPIAYGHRLSEADRERLIAALEDVMLGIDELSSRGM